MRRTGAQERKDNFKPKVTNNSLSRLPVEVNLRSYLRNRNLFSIIKNKEVCNYLREVEAPVFLQVCFLIPKKFISVELALHAFNYDTFADSIRKDIIYKYMNHICTDNIQTSVFYRNFNIS